LLCLLLEYIYIYYPSHNNSNNSNSNNNDDNSSIDNNRIKNIDFFNTSILYPIAMFICWLPSQLYNILYSNTIEYSSSYLLINNCLHIIAPLYGLLLSLIFYNKTYKARIILINILRYILVRLKIIEKSNEIELRESSKTISTSDISIDDVIHNSLIVRILE